MPSGVFGAGNITEQYKNKIPARMEFKSSTKFVNLDYALNIGSTV